MIENSRRTIIARCIPLEFGKDSPIVVVGSVIKGTFNDEVQYQVNADGIVPLEGYFPKE